MKDFPEKDYIGDGLYAQFANEMLMLTTEDGISATNTIFLEPEVFVALCHYIQRSPFAALIPKPPEIHETT